MTRRHPAVSYVIACVPVLCGLVLAINAVGDGVPIRSVAGVFLLAVVTAICVAVARSRIARWRGDSLVLDLALAVLSSLFFIKLVQMTLQ